MQVLEGHLGAHDSLHVLECLEAPFQVMVDVERAALAPVTQPAVMLHDGLHAPHDHVCPVIRIGREELLLLLISQQDAEARTTEHVIADQAGVIRRSRASLGVPVPVLAHRLTNEGVKHVGQPTQLDFVRVDLCIVALLVVTNAEEGIERNVGVTDAVVEVPEVFLTLIEAIVRDAGPKDEHETDDASCN